MDISNGDANSQQKSVNKINGRRLLTQVTATSIANLNQIDIGFSGSMAGILIAALTKNPSERNDPETPSMVLSSSQATWMGSIGYLFLPLGSLLSGFISDSLGRKRSMILLNIPFAIGWFILYQATEIWHVFVAIALQQLAVGLVKTTIINFVAEISDPSVRGVLNGYSNISASIGIFAAYTLNTLISWRSISLVGLIVPFISAISLILIPETPQWLLSKNRTKEAEKSLRWLRGFVPSEKVAEEFSELQRHSERSKSCNSCAKRDFICSHPPPTLTEKLSELKRKRTLKPFFILIPLFFLTQFTGIQAMDPYIINIFKAYKSPISADKAAAIMRFIENIGNVTFICLIRFTGKRRLYSAVGSGVFLSSLVISCYGFVCLPSGFISFGAQNESFHLENPNFAYIPTVSLFFWCFFSKSGFLSMPWLICSELFNFKTRGMALGIAAAMNYAFGFIGKKSYYDLELILSLPGVSMLFTVITGIGLVLMYFILPETEGRTLEDIELHFSDNSKKITDRKISKSKTSEENGKVQRNIENTEIIFQVCKSNGKMTNGSQEPDIVK